VTFVSNRWNAAQVLALAQDGSSRQAAARLAGIAHWSGAGAAGDVVWGLCAGSGKDPYQTIVDISGPAYTCSCPSRKFPCKHALGLLLAWADDSLPETGQLADFAESWVGARRARATAAAQPAERDERAAARRAEQREARVAAGLAELETWLRDQVRAGLSGTDGGYRHAEQIAARMVDAQAGGVAATLRGLGGIAVSGDGWPGRLLGAYAQLHLLIRAHERLDSLPADLAAVVRSHVGYTVARHDVLAGPAVSDRWLVLGVRDVLDGTVPARRIVLRGQHTARFALLLVFDPRGAFGGDRDAGLVPGTALHAAVHYYPGRAALRALIGERHGAPERAAAPVLAGVPGLARVPVLAGAPDLAAASAPAGGPAPAAGFVAVGGPVPASGPASAGGPAGGIAGLLDDWADALAGDPWLASWPALLSGTPLPTGAGWQFADASGQVVPLLTAGTDAWSLLAISGGGPVTVAGEWSADGLRPLTAWHGDTAVPL
jgi:hypothetical protein